MSCDVSKVMYPKHSSCCSDFHLPLLSKWQLWSCAQHENTGTHPGSFLILYMQFLSNAVGSIFKLHPESNLCLSNTSTTCIFVWASIISRLNCWHGFLFLSLCNPPLPSPKKTDPSRRLFILYHSLDEYPSMASYCIQNKSPNPCSNLQEPVRSSPHLSLWPLLLTSPSCC